MLFQLTNKLPEKYWVAVSGGVDSVAALYWLCNNKSKVLGVIHINHDTGDFADQAELLVRKWALLLELPFKYNRAYGTPPKKESKEMWWRNRRYAFFETFKEPVILAHNFDDCLEEYVMCCMVRGYAGTIPYQHGNCIRPFRLWKRKSIESYAKRHLLTWMEDPSNKNTKYKRNYIRHEIVPKLLELNPGVYNIVEKLVRKC